MVVCCLWGVFAWWGGGVGVGVSAAGSAGDVLLQVVGLVETLALTGDPAVAEPDVDSLVGRQGRDPRTGLGELEPDARLMLAVLLEPGSEGVGVGEGEDGASFTTTRPCLSGLT